MNLSLNRFSPRLPFESGTVLTALPLLIIASIFVWLGYLEWPGMHWDANFFAPPVVNVANGRGWHFGGYAPFYFLKLGDAYTFHGFLHIILYGVILKAEVDAFYWTVLAPDIVNPGREEQGSFSV
jgi:hypothetical protein